MVLVQARPARSQALDDDNGQKYFGQDCQVEFGLRVIGDYTPFADKENDQYKSGLRPTALDVLIGSDDPHFSWRISLENLAGARNSNSNYYIDAINYGRAETAFHLSMSGLAGAFIYHSPPQEKLRFYSGLGLGFYSAGENYTINTYDVISTVSSTGISASRYRGNQVGLNAFFGINYSISENVSFGLEGTARWLKINMVDEADDYAKDLSGYGWYLVFTLKPL